jgi:cephalosporin-C deacetylase-like acetyl esterase
MIIDIKRGNFRKINFIFLIVFGLASVCPTLVVQAQQDPNEKENLNVFQQWIKWNNPGSLLLSHLQKQADDFYSLRENKISLLKTKEDWLKRQKEVKDTLNSIMGEFPSRTPLNVKITGVIKMDGYKVEKMIYESTPGSYVTGCVFVPNKSKGRIPAVLYVVGHDQEGFRNKLYQTIMVNLVKKGMIVLAIDPPGQGEHLQYFDPKLNFSSVGYTVIEHEYFSNQCFLSGVTSAKYFIWEGIRGIDYLISRKDVDPERIGVTGFSGGGGIAPYIAAFDDRVKVSVPCSWPTASKKQLETKGVGDGETVFVDGLKKGITSEDIFEVRAPKPTLMTFVSRDQYLSVQAARDQFQEARIAYKAFGMEDNLEYAEDDSQHWITLKLRTAIYKFFMKHFDISGTADEVDVEVLSQKQLAVTPTGQISTSYGGDMIFDANKRASEKLIYELETLRKNIGKRLKTVNQEAKKISGYITPTNPTQEAFFNGRYRREGYSVGKYAIMGEGQYPIPILLFQPTDQKIKRNAIIYLHEEGKASKAEVGGDIEKLVKQGYVVAAADPLGFGETKNTAGRGQTDGYMGVLIGRSVVGIQAADIIRVLNFLKSRPDIDTMRIGAIATGGTCLPLVHAAAFDSSIKSIVLIRSLISYRSVVMNRIYKIGLTPNKKASVHHPYEVDFSWGVSNVLSGYDVPDLIGSIAPRKVLLMDLQNQNLEPADVKLIDTDMQFPRSAFSLLGVPKNLSIHSGIQDTDFITKWVSNNF